MQSFYSIELAKIIKEKLDKFKKNNIYKLIYKNSIKLGN